jgi:hypothetical protein
MIRFLKKFYKPSKKPVPPENPAHQATVIGAGHGRDSESEHPSRKIELIRPIGLIRPWHTDINRGEGSRVVNQDRGIEDQQLPAPNASTPTPGHEGGDASECDRLLLLGPTFIPRPDSATRTRTYV